MVGMINAKGPRVSEVNIETLLGENMQTGIESRVREDMLKSILHEV